MLTLLLLFLLLLLILPMLVLLPLLLLLSRVCLALLGFCLASAQLVLDMWFASAFCFTVGS